MRDRAIFDNISSPSFALHHGDVKGPFRRVRETRRERNAKVPARPTRIQPPVFGLTSVSGA